MPVRRFLKTKWGLVSVVAALLIGAYALVGFLIVPRVLRTALMKDLPATLGVLPRVGSIRCNPFLLRLDVADFALRSPAGQPIFGFERLLVTFDVASLWLRDYSFGAIELTAPYVNAVVDLDGTVNLERLARSTAAPPFGAPQPRQTDAPLPALRIGSFKVLRGSLAYLDRRRPDAASIRLEPIDFDLSEFSTGRSGGNFTLTGISKRGERLDWQGHVAVQPLESAGELRIADLRAQTLWEFIRDRVNFEVSSGTLGLTLRYRFEAGRLQLDVADVSLEALAVRPRAGDQDWLTVPGLHLDRRTRRCRRTTGPCGACGDRGAQRGGMVGARRFAEPSALGAGRLPGATRPPGARRRYGRCRGAVAIRRPADRHRWRHGGARGSQHASGGPLGARAAQGAGLLPEPGSDSSVDATDRYASQ
jgi:hypothetical protein